MLIGFFIFFHNNTNTLEYFNSIYPSLLTDMYLLYILIF